MILRRCLAIINISVDSPDETSGLYLGVGGGAPESSDALGLQQILGLGVYASNQIRFSPTWYISIRYGSQLQSSIWR